MKKIPTMYERVFEGHKIVGIKPVFTSEICREALERGTPTIKYDGAACFMYHGILYKRVDLGKAKKSYSGLELILCEEKPDEVTGHWPAWVRTNKDDPADRWFIQAKDTFFDMGGRLSDGSYEAVGPHFQGNPYNMEADTLIRHGEKVVMLPDRSIFGVKAWLEANNHEGLVFWLDGKPACKIKRSDFGLPWPVKKA